MNEEELMAGRLCELAERSYNDNYYIYTEFLGIAQISLLHKLARSDDRMKGIKYTLYGGAKDSERMVAAFGDESVFGYPPEFPVSCILVKPKNAKFADKLSHRDYLGAVMNLGIGREQIGDIIIDDNCGYIFCLDGMVDYIVNNLERVRHTVVTCEPVDDIPDSEDNVKEMSVIVPSERLDVVSARVYKMSRNEVQGLIKQSKVYINGIQCESAGVILNSDDKVTVRGYGRYRYGGVIRNTAKGKMVVNVFL